MMMRSLIAGGMDASFSRERDQRMNAMWGEADVPDGYVPNEDYYELDTADYQAHDFPAQFEGKLIKCLWGAVDRMLPTLRYRIIFMRRPTEEIRASMIAAFGMQEETADPHFEKRLRRVIDCLRDRRSVLSVDEVWLGDVMKNPVATFKRLRNHGWPVDPDAAASVPNRLNIRFGGSVR